MSLWPIYTTSSVDVQFVSEGKCCRLLENRQSDDAILSECHALSSDPYHQITDASLRWEKCCKKQIEAERKLLSSGIVRDIIIGLSDGLMVPFALTAGLSSLGSSKLVYQGGFAELIAGAISMDIGGYLSAKSEQDIFRHRFSAIADRLSLACPSEIKCEIHEVLEPFGVGPSLSRLVAENLEIVQREEAAKKDLAFVPNEKPFTSPLGRFTPFSRRSDQYGVATRGTSAFLIQLGEGLQKIPTRRLFISVFTIGMSYFLGGLIPIIPYLCVPGATHGLYWSILAADIILVMFGAATVVPLKPLTTCVSHCRSPSLDLLQFFL